MTEIKFRQPIFDSEGNFVKYHYWGFIDGVFFKNAGYLILDMQKYILIQERYTGLKDKNGKEIYENDVVSYYDDRIGIVFENVVYEDGYFRPLVQIREGYGEIDKYYDMNFQNHGSIYENSELLNKI